MDIVASGMHHPEPRTLDAGKSQVDRMLCGSASFALAGSLSQIRIGFPNATSTGVPGRGHELPVVVLRFRLRAVGDPRVLAGEVGCLPLIDHLEVGEVPGCHSASVLADLLTNCLKATSLTAVQERP